MEVARTTWSDERLDDLAHRVDDGFRRTDEDIRGLRTDMSGRFDAMERRFDALQQTLFQVGGGLLVAIVATLITVLVTSG